jgi:hypothetical protein
MHRMRVKWEVALGLVVALVLLPAAASAHGVDDGGGYGSWSPDLPNPLLDNLAVAPTPHFAGAADPEPPMPAMPGRLELLGHDPLLNRGMNAAIAVKGRYVYVGNRTDGTHLDAEVLIVDVGDPAHPAIAGRIGPPNEANPGESSRELRILPDKDILMVLNHPCSEAIHRCASPSTTAGVSEARSNVKFYDISGANAAAPKLLSTYLPPRNQPQIPHEIFLWTDPRQPSRVLMYWTAPSRASANGKPNLYVTDISRAREGIFTELANWTTVIDNPDRDNRLHSLTVSYDGTRAYLAFLGGGFMVADTSDFANNVPNPQIRLVTPVDKRVFWTDPGAHSAIKVPGQPYAMITDEVYGKLGALLPAHGCPWGWIRFINVADEAAPQLTSEYKLPVNDPSTCASVSPVRDNFASFSSHNPTLTRHLAFVTWHSEGLQVVDISDPAHPSGAANYLPVPLDEVQTEDPALSSGEDKVVMWSFPVIQDGIVYAVDIRNGLYVFRYHGPHSDEVASTHFLDGNTNSGDYGRFEYAREDANGNLGQVSPDDTVTVKGSSRPLPLAIPARACVPGGALTRDAHSVGPFRLGAARTEIDLRAGPPVRRRGAFARWCADGRRRITVAYTRAGTARLVLVTGQRGRVPRGTHRVAPDLRVKGRRIYFVRDGQLRYTGVASRALIARPAALRALVRAASRA